MTLTRRLARPMLSSIFVAGPIATLKSSAQAAEQAAPVTEPIVRALQRAGLPVPHDPETLVRLNAGVQLAAAAALASGRCPRSAAAVLAASLVPTTLAGHAFWRESDSAVRRRQQIEFAKNLSLLGGLVISALDTEGRPGKAWLARSAARQLGKRADHLVTTARLEGRIAELNAVNAINGVNPGIDAGALVGSLGESLGDAAGQLGDRTQAAAGRIAAAGETVAARVAERSGELGELAAARGRVLRRKGRKARKQARRQVKTLRTSVRRTDVKHLVKGRG